MFKPYPLTIVLRGLPGSGKSTLAKKLKEMLRGMGLTVVIVSADDHFTAPDGQYTYVPSEIGNAHQSCWTRFYGFVSSDYFPDVIIVDNTNVHEGEIAPYVLPSECNGFRVVIVSVDAEGASAEELAKRTLHGVPQAVIARMATEGAWATLPPYWKTLKATVNTDPGELFKAAQELVS
jgi:hypothetical protein